MESKVLNSQVRKEAQNGNLSEATGSANAQGGCWGYTALLGEGSLPGSGQAKGWQEEEQDQLPWLNQERVISQKWISKKICQLVRALAQTRVPLGPWQCLHAHLSLAVSTTQSF